MEQNGVVSVFDPTSFEIEWRDIPGWSSYEVSNLGVIRHKRLERICGTYETITSKGTYLALGAVNDEKTKRTSGQHILICLAFHGLPPTPNHEVNHKDGNKHNNLPGNLEWMTRGDNIKHAYMEGLRKENRKVVMTDIETNTQTEFYSMGELGRYIGITKASVWSFVQKHKTDPYQGKYTFRFVAGETKIADRDSTKIIYGYDCVKEELHVFANLAELELYTGIKRGQTYYHLVRNSKQMVKGWYFSYIDNFGDFPEITDEAIMISHVMPANGKGTPIRVIDSETNTTKIYASIPDLARAINVTHPNTIRRAIYEKDGKFGKYHIQLISSSTVEKSTDSESL